MMVDVVLVSPPSAVALPSAEKTVSHLGLPLGLGYLASTLETAGYSVRIIDMPVEHIVVDQFKQLLLDEQPAVVGIASVINTHNNAIRLAHIIKQVCPATKVVIGGPHASFLPGQTLKDSPADVVCLFESEYTFLEVVSIFVDHKGNLAQVKGIVFKDGARQVKTAARPSIENVDLLPFPARHLFHLDRYVHAGNLITARGCPFHCTFCSASAVPGKPYRPRSPANVISEIELMVCQFGMRHLSFDDDTFSTSLERVRQICNGMKEKHLDVTWDCQVRASTASRELFELLVESGCAHVEIGAESGCNHVLRSIRKDTTTNQIESAVQTAHDVGLEVDCGFIIGHPTDTRDTVIETLRFATKLRRIGTPQARVITGFRLLTPLPGTFVYDHAAELGLCFTTRNWDEFTFIDPVIETRYLSKHELRNFIADALVEATLYVQPS